MVCEGSAETNNGDGLAQCINEYGRIDAMAFHIAARLCELDYVDGSRGLCKGIGTAPVSPTILLAGFKRLMAAISMFGW